MGCFLVLFALDGENNKIHFFLADDIFYAQRLMSATVNLISQRKCKNEYYDYVRVTDNMVCAGDPRWQTDACKVKLVGLFSK